MTSEKQIEANQRNARKSTGPRTPEGKARSRLNAATHGATAMDVMLLPGEDPDVFRSCVRSIHQTYEPVGGYEFALVQRIAFTEWRLSRLHRFETGMVRAGLGNVIEAESALDIAHDETESHEEADCACEHDRREDRPERKAPLAWEDDLAEITRLLSKTLEGKLTELNLFARYEVALQRNIERTGKMLERVQSRRLERQSARSSSTSDDWRQLEEFLRADTARRAQEMESIDEEARRQRELYRLMAKRKGTPTLHPKAPPSPMAVRGEVEKSAIGESARQEAADPHPDATPVGDGESGPHAERAEPSTMEGEPPTGRQSENGTHVAAQVREAQPADDARCAEDPGDPAKDAL